MRKPSLWHPIEHLQLAALVGEGHTGEGRLALLTSAESSEVLGSLGDGLVEELEGQTTSYTKVIVNEKEV